MSPISRLATYISNIWHHTFDLSEITRENKYLARTNRSNDKSLPIFTQLRVAKHCNSTYPRIVSYIFPPDHFPRIRSSHVPPRRVNTLFDKFWAANGPLRSLGGEQLNTPTKKAREEEREGGRAPPIFNRDVNRVYPPFLPPLINCRCFETLANTYAVNNPGKSFRTPVLQIATGFSTPQGWMNTRERRWK